MLIRTCLLAVLAALCLSTASAREVPGPWDALSRADRPALAAWRGATDFGPPVPCGVVDRQVRFLNPYPVLGEPLLIQVRYTYRPNRVELPPAEVQAIMAMVWNTDIAATIQPQGMRASTFDPGARGARGQRRAMTLREGRPQSAAAVLAYDKNTLSMAAFDAPGPHAVVVHSLCVPPEAESQRLIGTPDNANEWSELGGVVIEVREPEGDDAVAWDILEGTGAFQSIQEQRVVRTSHGELLRRVVREAPSAAVTPHALATLANTLVIESRNDPEKLAEPLLLLEQLLRDHVDSFAAPSAAVRAIDIHLLRGDEDAARALFRKAWEHPNLSRAFSSDSKTVDFFLKLEGAAPEEQWMLFDRGVAVR